MTLKVILTAALLACTIPLAAQQMSAEMLKAASVSMEATEEDPLISSVDTSAVQTESGKVIQPDAAETPAPAEAEKSKKKKPVSASAAPVAPAAPAAPAAQPALASAPAPVALETRSAAEVAAAELDFLKGQGGSKDDDVLEALLPRVADWLKAYPDSARADEALLLKANLQIKLGDHKAAIIALLKHSQEYPESALRGNVRLLLNTTIDRKLNKKLKAPLNALADGSGPDKAERLAILIAGLAGQFGEEFYDPLLAEFKEFFVRFPVYAGRDAVQLSLGALYSAKGEYIDARLSYEELIQVYPASVLMARAKRALGDVLANNLKDYFAAVKVYQDITDKFPGTEEAWAAYEQLPRLTERQKLYQQAVEVYERIIVLYPSKPEARSAFKSEARILREEMNKPAEAIAVLNRLADKYKDEKAIEELYLAAEIARKDLKDLPGEVKMYDRIAADYPANKEAPRALLAAGQAYEKAKDTEKAKSYYESVKAKYPDDASAKKAQKYIEALIKG